MVHRPFEAILGYLRKRHNLVSEVLSTCLNKSLKKSKRLMNVSTHSPLIDSHPDKSVTKVVLLNIFRVYSLVSKAPAKENYFSFIRHTFLLDVTVSTTVTTGALVVITKKVTCSNDSCN